MAGWNGKNKRADAPKAPNVPMWVQWTLALIALGLGAWFGWMMF